MSLIVWSDGNMIRDTLKLTDQLGKDEDIVCYKVSTHNHSKLRLGQLAAVGRAAVGSGGGFPEIIIHKATQGVNVLMLACLLVRMEVYCMDIVWYGEEMG